MPPRARLGHAAVAAAIVLLLAGCGNDEPAEDQPSKAAQSCRDDWKELAAKVRGNDTKTNPSALAQRWTSVAATVDYYATSATAEGCDEAIAQQEEAISALEEFGEKLAPYDMELRLEQVRDAAEAYAAGPTPAPSPSPSPAKKGDKKKQKKAKQPPAPPSPPTISNAVKTLVAQAPVATEQQGPGWQQASVVELSDKAAVAKAVKDLAFLSTESSAWRACRAALARINTALAAAG
ncbi:MAG: hypothetical protein ABWY19_00845 [Marmoricola sp.]